MVNRNVLMTIALVVALAIFIVVVTAYTQTDSIEIDETFSELPEKPEDFIIIKRAIEKGETTNICNVEEEYYKNPDFYPTWEQGKQIFYDNHDYSRWGVHGYGSYPAENGANINNLKKGEYIDFCTLFKTSYGIETYQGVKMVFENNKYFNVEIINQEFPKYKNHFIMYPTFPKFHNNWSKNLHIRITAKEDILPGKYDFGFNVIAPSQDFNDEMVWKILMQDTNKDESYVKNCVDEISKSQVMSEIDTECEKFMMQRQKKYIKGGGWSIGRDMYAITLEVK